MTKPKSTATLGGVLLIGAALGAGGNEAARPRLDIAAQPTSLRMTPDGFGLDVALKVGPTAGALHTLNWDRTGGAPLLGGQPFDDDDARAIGAAALAFTKVAEERSNSLASKLAAWEERVAPPAPK